MHFALIADAFPPMRSSAAVQLRDLSAEFVRQGHHVTVFIPAPDISDALEVSDWRGVEVVRIKTFKTKDVGYIRRTLAEVAMPWRMWRAIKHSPYAKQAWDGIIWYSPSIFFGPLVKRMKRLNQSRGYLILRDIFPEWAVDMGLMGRGLPYRFFRAIARDQYRAADIIGIQTPGNASYFSDKESRHFGRREVLHNWLADTPARPCPIKLADTALAGRTLLVYAGNMGIAQGTDIFIALAERLKERQDVGFVFVGRGSEAPRLRNEARQRGLDNVLFFDEIDPDDIPGLYAQCDVGLLALDPRHRSHNIPGKFLSYMQAGLPVLARVNPGNDIVDLIAQECVGEVSTSESIAALEDCLERLLAAIHQGTRFDVPASALAERLFSPSQAVQQVVNALRP